LPSAEWQKIIKIPLSIIMGEPKGISGELLGIPSDWLPLACGSVNANGFVMGLQLINQFLKIGQNPMAPMCDFVDEFVYGPL
jgi:hypothetical protein